MLTLCRRQWNVAFPAECHHLSTPLCPKSPAALRACPCTTCDRPAPSSLSSSLPAVPTAWRAQVAPPAALTLPWLPRASNFLLHSLPKHDLQQGGQGQRQPPHAPGCSQAAPELQLSQCFLMSQTSLPTAAEQTCSVRLRERQGAELCPRRQQAGPWKVCWRRAGQQWEDLIMLLLHKTNGQVSAVGHEANHPNSKHQPRGTCTTNPCAQHCHQGSLRAASHTPVLSHSLALRGLGAHRSTSLKFSLNLLRSFSQENFKPAASKVRSRVLEWAFHHLHTASKPTPASTSARHSNPALVLLGLSCVLSFPDTH